MKETVEREVYKCDFCETETQQVRGFKVHTFYDRSDTVHVSFGLGGRTSEQVVQPLAEYGIDQFERHICDDCYKWLRND